MEKEHEVETLRCRVFWHRKETQSLMKLTDTWLGVDPGHELFCRPDVQTVVGVSCHTTMKKCGNDEVLTVLSLECFFSSRFTSGERIPGAH